MDWYRLSIDADLVAAGKVASVKDRFTASFRAAGGPRAMALFQRPGEEGAIELFFTPDCGAFGAGLLDELGAEPCDGPALVGLELLVGHNEITYYLTT
ncbi:MAG TPA: hypothetical protein DCZ75_08415 [Geobacter sp.]|nr:hypothetical protein [Geobacter sp.]